MATTGAGTSCHVFSNRRVANSMAQGLHSNERRKRRTHKYAPCPWQRSLAASTGTLISCSVTGAIRSATAAKMETTIAETRHTTGCSC